ncbi:hypothetical protein [Nocardia sp. CC201C]|uniref:hypothetical protein n=1 Tax=Nocardia sp. CC201C TaxID=3044575 RepID=UPI0024A8389B|nr:hypothetical protein [Nocardia sp. CC201C]
MAQRTGRDNHTAEPLPPIRIDKPPTNASPRIWLRAYGVRRPCPTCGADETFVAGVFPVYPADTFHLLILVTTASAWRLAKQILERSQVAGDLAAAIRRRSDPTSGEDRFMGGCPQCDTPYAAGSDPMLRETVAERRLAALTPMPCAECSVVKWHRALYDPVRVFVRL